MRALVEGAHGDLRLLLGQMQMVRLSAAAMQYDDVKRQALNAKVGATARMSGQSSCSSKRDLLHGCAHRRLPDGCEAVASGSAIDGGRHCACILLCRSP